jgi:hypothetical protein
MLGTPPKGLSHSESCSISNAFLRIDAFTTAQSSEQAARLDIHIAMAERIARLSVLHEDLPGKG